MLCACTRHGKILRWVAAKFKSPNSHMASKNIDHKRATQHRAEDPKCAVLHRHKSITMIFQDSLVNTFLFLMLDL